MVLLYIPRGSCTVRLLGRSSGLRHSWRQQRAQYSSAQTPGTLIFEAQSGPAIRMLKFMSLTGATIACTATVGVTIAQSAGKLSDDELGVVSLLVASVVSVASTLAVNRMFGPFVTRVTLLPARPVTMRADSHGLPKFDSILSRAQTSSAQGLLKGRVSSSTELLLESPGVLGINSRTTRVQISDLMPSARGFRTWELTRAAQAARAKANVPTPLTSFTVLWKTLKSSPNRDIMQEISTMIGPV
ncbi:hypothetical protein IW137_003172 [Coemansia sp. RSA 1287]|nr:hypothetical protein IW137_003172 [Coemansia sp. RSA 1287]